MSTIAARLICDEPTARRLASVLAESVEDAACAAFEGADGRWQLAVHLRDAADEGAIRALVRTAAGDLADALTFDAVAETDWVAASLAGLKPVRVGRFVVHGAHDRANVAINAIGIEIEAALAFGTGHHGTTAGCLLALDAIAKRKRAMRIIDIGCGTGVLAIAAAKRFRTRVMASDIDPSAVSAARTNARLNRLAPLVNLVRATGTRSPAVGKAKPFDLIFANILLGPLTWLAVPLRRLAAPGARIVLSGLLPAHANAALAIYRAQGLALERRILRDGWATLILLRRKQNRPGRG